MSPTTFLRELGCPSSFPQELLGGADGVLLRGELFRPAAQEVVEGLLELERVVKDNLEVLALLDALSGLFFSQRGTERRLRTKVMYSDSSSTSAFSRLILETLPLLQRNALTLEERSDVRGPFGLLLVLGNGKEQALKLLARQVLNVSGSDLKVLTRQGFEPLLEFLNLRGLEALANPLPLFLVRGVRDPDRGLDLDGFHPLDVAVGFLLGAEVGELALPGGVVVHPRH